LKSAKTTDQSCAGELAADIQAELDGTTLALFPLEARPWCATVLVDVGLAIPAREAATARIEGKLLGSREGK
jgi:hypothetical protein